MKQIKVVGQKILSGNIEISGAKNSAVALLPAAILSDEVVIKNVPSISDVRALEDILSYLGADVYKEGNKLTINTKKVKNIQITEDFSNMLRASYYFMGSMLARFKEVQIAFPGGCKIGERPIDIHLAGFEKLGVKIKKEDNTYILKADKLIGSEITLPFPSVGATVNVLLAATKAEGKTIIRNAAKEPEIGNLIDFLISMGAKIKGRDTDTLEIEGVKKLTGGCVQVMADRIEAGTYILAGVMTGKDLKISNMNPNHLTSLINLLKEMGANIKVFDDYVIASKSEFLKPVSVTTEVYPGFPTDLQQPLTSLLILANGTSYIKENIYENRFQNVSYLKQMGADIEIDGDTLTINGPKELIGGVVTTSDLRAGAALILAALVAKGTTTIKEVKYVLRGYGNIVNKLTNVGGEIVLEDV